MENWFEDYEPVSAKGQRPDLYDDDLEGVEEPELIDYGKEDRGSDESSDDEGSSYGQDISFDEDEGGKDGGLREREDIGQDEGEEERPTVLGYKEQQNYFGNLAGTKDRRRKLTLVEKLAQEFRDTRYYSSVDETAIKYISKKLNNSETFNVRASAAAYTWFKSKKPSKEMKKWCENMDINPADLIRYGLILGLA